MRAQYARAMLRSACHRRAMPIELRAMLSMLRVYADDAARAMRCRGYALIALVIVIRALLRYSADYADAIRGCFAATPFSPLMR